MGTEADDDVTAAEEALQPLLQKIIDENASRWLKRLLRHRDALVYGRRKRLGEFEDRLYARWAAALDDFELALHVAQECGALFNRQFHTQVTDPNRPQFTALIRLHAHASMIAGEVLHLLRGGFATGAHARWRSLHETAVVMMLLEDSPPETAQRFLDHAAVKSFEDAQRYNRYSARLGYEPFTDKEMAAMSAAVDRLTARYGKDFTGSYGWAKSELHRRNPNRSGSVKFEELESCVNIDFWRPYYRWASHGVHPTAKSIEYKRGSRGLRNVMLAGPSNYGLADPGSEALRSLCNASSSLLCPGITIAATRAELTEGDIRDCLDRYYKPALALQVMVVVLDEIARIAEVAFFEAHQQLEAEEKSICRAERRGKLMRRQKGLT